MKLAFTAATCALTVALAGCYQDDEYNNAAEYNAADANYSAGNADYDAAGGNGYASATPGNWPEGARIVVENGVTYRIDPGGARVTLGPNDARVEVVDGVRYRIDPGGTRVRIDDQGATIRVPVSSDTSVEVNTN